MGGNSCSHVDTGLIYCSSYGGLGQPSSCAYLLVDSDGGCGLANWVGIVGNLPSGRRLELGNYLPLYPAEQAGRSKD